MQLISLDTETTGGDHWHGAKPFYVSTCQEDGTVTAWEWDVDPLTREPIIPPEDLRDIQDLLAEHDRIVLQNPKFDFHALDTIGFWRKDLDWVLNTLKMIWKKTEDTLTASHVLASNQLHDLTSLAVQYLGTIGADMQAAEDDLEKCVQECRRLCRSEYPTWRIAKEGLPEMPSAKEKTWKFDCWLPRAIAIEQKLPKGHNYWRVLSTYANLDSIATLALWQVMEQELRRKDLWKIYRFKMATLPIASSMETRGITIHKGRSKVLKRQYQTESERCGRVLVNIAKDMGFDLKLPKGASPNNSLKDFVFNGLKLEKRELAKSTSDQPSLAKEVMDHYQMVLPPKSKSRFFIDTLLEKRKRDTAISYLEGYENFWLPTELEEWFILHCSYNPTGSDTLRWASYNPNAQNISRKEGFNLRLAFGPAPGREWWSLDAVNVEKRIPVYGGALIYGYEQPELISLFERADDPPFFGSDHALVCSIIYPREFEKAGDGKKFKKDYPDLYKRGKSMNLGMQYGSGEATAERTSGVKGSYRLIKNRLSKMEDYNRMWIRYAEKHGYVESLPDKTVNPRRGYPILCTRSERGRILSTVPLNYHVQSTAMWFTMRAMIRCQAKLDEWRELTGFDGYIALQVHDELVFDFPKSAIHPSQGRGISRLSNLWRVRILQKLMEQGADDIGLKGKLPVGIEYNEFNWSEGVVIT